MHDKVQAAEWKTTSSSKCISCCFNVPPFTVLELKTGIDKNQTPFPTLLRSRWLFVLLFTVHTDHKEQGGTPCSEFDGESARIHLPSHIFTRKPNLLSHLEVMCGSRTFYDLHCQTCNTMPLSTAQTQPPGWDDVITTFLILHSHYIQSGPSSFSSHCLFITVCQSNVSHNKVSHFKWHDLEWCSCCSWV